MSPTEPNTTPTALDRLIIADATVHMPATPGRDILVLDDPTSDLTGWALDQVGEGGRVLSRQRLYTDAQHLRTRYPNPALIIAGLTPQGQIDPTTFGLGDFLKLHAFDGTLAIGRLPKSHAALADIAHDFASYQVGTGRQAALLLGGNTKHMQVSFNQTLGRDFSQVQGLRGQGKHRCLLATGPQPADSPAHQAGPLKAVGGVFSGAKPDRGGQLLATCALDHLANARPSGPVTMLDLGCGNGSVTAQVLKNLPAGVEVARVWASDVDSDAVRSASLNLGQDARVEVTWDNAASRLQEQSLDYVLLNPPFHTGTAVDLSLVGPLLDSAVRLLAPGGRLFLVHNSHARYRPQVEARFEQVQQLERTPTFTVLTATAPAGAVSSVHHQEVTEA